MGPTSKFFLQTLNLFLVVGATSVASSSTSTPSSRKLDEVKCAPCQTVPPPPPPPSPPPPCPPPPTPVFPPPAPKKPPSSYCPPPPSSPSGYIYITGQPGSLYPIDNDFGGGHRNFAVGLPALIGSGLVGLLGFLIFGN